ncbi:MAG: hypothetical protein Q8Q09_12495 [Deltaproteobacteria bacterium]|nr:hypothetical protein [Deltaproteobacteria bacterium]
MQKRCAAMVAASALGFAVATLGKLPEAHAQTLERISASPQGVIGGALLGMELVILIEGAAGVRNGWVMLGTGLAGGIAGGVGGFFLDQALDGNSAVPASQPTQGMTAISTGLMVVGFGLIIPTAVVFTGALMYRPPEVSSTPEETSTTPLEESRGANGATPSSNESSSGATSTTPAPTTGNTSALRRRRAPIARPQWVPSLLSFGAQGPQLGVPSFGLVRSYSLEEQRQYNLTPQSEWRVQLLSGTF